MNYIILQKDKDGKGFRPLKFESDGIMPIYGSREDAIADMQGGDALFSINEEKADASEPTFDLVEVKIAILSDIKRLLESRGLNSSKEIELPKADTFDFDYYDVAVATEVSTHIDSVEVRQSDYEIIFRGINNDTGEGVVVSSNELNLNDIYYFFFQLKNIRNK